MPGVLKAMRGGDVLYREIGPKGDQYWLSDGVIISPDVGRAVAAHVNVYPSRDGLFPQLSQTFYWKDTQ
jgi:hypothetical protein